MNIYWAQRMANSQEEKTLKNIKEVNEELKKYFSKSLIRLIAQFEATYDKLLLTVGEGRTPTPADLYNLDKYWELQNQLRIELQKLGDKQITFLSKKFMAQYAEVYEGIAIKGDLKFRKADTAAVAQIINQIWCADGKSWSQRIWENTDLLQQKKLLYQTNSFSYLNNHLLYNYLHLLLSIIYIQLVQFLYFLN